MSETGAEEISPEEQPVDSVDQSETVASGETEQSRGTVWKYRIIKAIDVSGLTFITPVVRLMTWEEPRKQLAEIGRLIVIPVLAFLMFLGLWNVLAPKHKTKSGEVPTPNVVWDAGKSIWKFHQRESHKETAFQLTGEKRDQYLPAVQLRLAKVKVLEERANQRVAQAEAQAVQNISDLIAPVERRYDALQENYRQAQSERVTRLKSNGNGIESNSEESRNRYLRNVRDHIEQTETEQEELKELKAEIDSLRSEKQPGVVAALKYQTKVAEERQYLEKLEQLLTVSNLGTKVEALDQQIASQDSRFEADAGTGQAFESAEKLVSDRIRLEKLKESEYAKPWTLPMQIYRSVFCVFTGFILGAAIAIPLGILCGLSRTFMAAVTPFIALFKPVSPIVWLPITLIIVGGFIEDPDKHWLILALAKLPLIGWMKINPAFMACAITVALCSLWATLVNTALGVASIEKDHLNVASVLRLNFKDRLFKIIIPSALPLIFAGLRISLGVGWMVLIAAELLSGSEGIGKFVWDQFSNGASDSFAKMFVVVFVVGIVGLVLDRIMIVFQRLVTFDGAPTAI